MKPEDLVVEVVGRLPLLLLVGLVSIVGAVVAGVYLLRGRPHPALTAAPVALPLVVVGVAAWLAQWDDNPVRGVGAAAGLRLLALFCALPSAVVLAGFAAAAGARVADRQWKAAALTLGLTLASGGVALAGGIAEEDWMYPAIRAGAYAVLGVLVAAAVLGHREHPEAAATSGAVLALVVGAGEASARALEVVFLLAVLPSVIPEGRLAYVDQAWHDVIIPSALWHTLAEGLGYIAAVVAIGIAGRSATRGRAPEGPAQTPAYSALLWVALMVLGASQGAPDLDALHAAAAVPSPAPPAP